MTQGSDKSAGPQGVGEDPEGGSAGMPTQELQEQEEPAPDDFDGWFARGLRHAQLGFPDRAAAAFEQAALIRPHDAATQFNMGTAHLSLGNFIQAVTNLDHAIALEPENSDAYGNRAVAFAALGEDDRAERDVARAIELGAPPDGLNAVLDYVRARRAPNRDE